MSDKSKPRPSQKPRPKPLREDKGRTVPKPPAQIRPPSPKKS